MYDTSMTTVIFSISIFTTGALTTIRDIVDCSPFFIIHHDSTNTLEKINTVCEFCQGNQNQNKDNETVQVNFTACTSTQSTKRTEFLLSYNVSNTNYCRLQSATDNTRLSSNGNTISLFQNCSEDRAETRELREKSRNSTRIVISVICMSIMVILLSVYFGLMFHYRCCTRGY